MPASNLTGYSFKHKPQLWQFIWNHFGLTDCNPSLLKCSRIISPGITQWFNFPLSITYSCRNFVYYLLISNVCQWYRPYQQSLLLFYFLFFTFKCSLEEKNIYRYKNSLTRDPSFLSKHWASIQKLISFLLFSADFYVCLTLCFTHNFITIKYSVILNIKKSLNFYIYLLLHHHDS